MSQKQIPEKLLWIDLEMTGLDPEKEVIIEVAALVTDFDFKTLDSYEAVIYQDTKFIQNMDEWNQKHHTESGLVDKIPNGKPQDQVENDLIQLIQKNFDVKKNGKPILAGNSIHQDRAFIQRHLKKFNEQLHYRMLDISSWKVILQGKFKFEYKKQNKHRATDDILESIEELKTYLHYLGK